MHCILILMVFFQLQDGKSNTGYLHIKCRMICNYDIYAVTKYIFVCNRIFLHFASAAAYPEYGGIHYGHLRYISGRRDNVLNMMRLHFRTFSLLYQGEKS